MNGDIIPDGLETGKHLCSDNIRIRAHLYGVNLAAISNTRHAEGIVGFGCYHARNLCSVANGIRARRATIVIHQLAITNGTEIGMCAIQSRIQHNHRHPVSVGIGIPCVGIGGLVVRQHQFQAVLAIYIRRKEIERSVVHVQGELTDRIDGCADHPRARLELRSNFQ